MLEFKDLTHKEFSKRRFTVGRNWFVFLCLLVTIGVIQSFISHGYQLHTSQPYMHSNVIINNIADLVKGFQPSNLKGNPSVQKLLTSDLDIFSNGSIRWKDLDGLCGAKNKSINVRRNTAGGSPPNTWFPFLDFVVEDNFVILSNANCGFVPFALNFWKHYARLGYTNIVFIAEDCQAYSILVEQLGQTHVAPPLFKRQSTEAQNFESDGYRDMVAMRPAYVHYFLNRGVSVLWQDVDSVPIKDPMQFFPPGFDAVLVDDNSTDYHYSSKMLCSGLMFFTPSHSSLDFLSDWRVKLIESSKNTNQGSFNDVLVGMRKKHLISVLILPRMVYPNGKDYDEFANTSAWIHANWRVGQDNKIDFLKQRGYWDPPSLNLDCS